MTHSKLYRAPFGPGGSAGIDEAVCRRLIEAALSSGGDYADLFFEYRAAGSLFFEDGITKSASRGVSLGLGVRVRKGDATGYAHVEDLELEAMKRAAHTAAQIARAGKAQTTSLPIVSRSLPQRYELGQITLDAPGTDKRALLERASQAAHAHDPSIVKAQVSFSEEIREILVCTSLGHFCRDSQPLIRFGVTALAERNGKRESGRSGGG